jgi:hypothetical protein
MATKQKIVLDFPSTIKLGTEGRCEIEVDGKFSVGSTYPLAHFSGYAVRVERIFSKKKSKWLELSLLEVIEPENERKSRKIKLLKLCDKGAFIGKKEKYQLGEVLAVAEPYCMIWDRLDGDEKVEFMHRVADAHGVEVEKARGLYGWYNADKVKPELMEHKDKVVEAFSVNAREIVPELWEEIGLKWLSEEFEEMKKRDYIGSAKWNANKPVIIYRYETEVVE